MRVVLHLAPGDGLQIALEIGRDFGRELASGITGTDDDLAASLETVAALMQREGFEIVTDPAGEKLLTEHCPFSANKFEHPEVLCSLDRGIMTGIFEIVDPQRAAALEANLEMDHACVTTV